MSVTTVYTKAGEFIFRGDVEITEYSKEFPELDFIRFYDDVSGISLSVPKGDPIEVTHYRKVKGDWIFDQVWKMNPYTLEKKEYKN